MKIFLQTILYFSLIINALNACAGKSSSDCSSDSTCQWVNAVEAKCEAIENVLTTECENAKASDTACEGIKNGETSLCDFTEDSDGDATKNTCEPITATITGLCSTNAAKASESACTGIKGGNTVLCAFTAGAEAQCKSVPVQFGATTIKLKSVKGKAVVITIEPVAADKEKKVTEDTTIQNLQLNSGTSFTKDLTCKIASGSTLGDVDCTMDTAATKDTKYKLISKSTVTYKGNDEFGTVTVDGTEVTATEDTSSPTSPENNSSYLKISSFFTFLFLLF